MSWNPNATLQQSNASQRNSNVEMNKAIKLSMLKKTNPENSNFKILQVDMQ